jgi:hypothetical protein
MHYLGLKVDAFSCLYRIVIAIMLMRQPTVAVATTAK